MTQRPTSTRTAIPGGAHHLGLDVRAVVTDASPAAVELLGASVTTWCGRRFTDLVHDADRATAAAIVDEVAKVPGASCRLRLRIAEGDVDGDGGHRLVVCAVENHLDDPEAPTVAVSFAPSTTIAPTSDAADTRDDLAVGSINPIAAILDEDSLGVLLSASGGVTFFSPALAAALRYELSELHVRFMDLFHADEQALLADYIQAVNSPDGLPAVAQLRVVRGDGTWTRVELRTLDLSHDPDYAAFVTTVTPVPETGGDHPTEARGGRSALRDAIDLAVDPVVMMGRNGRIRYASASASSVLGRQNWSLLGVPLTNLIAPDDEAAVLAWLADPAPGSEVRARIAHPDGAVRWAVLRPLFSATSGADRHLVMTARDIHEQAVAEEALRQREEWFATLIRNAPGCVIVLDENDRVRYTSPSIERVLGLRADAVADMDLWGRAHPDDDTTFRAAVRRACAADVAVTCRGRLRVGDGSWRWFEATLQQHDDEVLDGMVVNLLDRTDEVVADQARRESERRYASLVQHSFEITAILDDDLTIAWISPSATELLGWGVDEVIGSSALDFIHPDDLTSALANLEAALHEVSPRPFTMVRVRDRAIAWRWVVASLADRRNDPDIAGLIINLRDATEQVADKQALEASEARYRTLVQNSTDVVQIMSASAQVLWVSPAVQNVLGYHPDELVNEATGALAGLSGREELVTSFLEVLRSPGATERCVSRARHADGSWRWIDVVLVNLLDQPGIEGIVATYRDITERIEADQARRTSEERFRSLAESSPLGIFQLDLDQQCTYVNERWCEITGLSDAASMGDGWRTPIRRGGDLLGRADADIDDYVATGPGLQIVHESGEVRWCALHVAPLTDDQGERIGSVGTIDDITSTVDARHEARRLSTILQATPDLVMLFVPEGTLVYLNAAACRFFEFDRDADVRGIPVSQIMPEENLSLWQSEILPTLESGEPWQGETFVTNRSGEVIPISAVVIAHHGASGEIEMVSITARDMSDRMALEARLQHQATHDPLTGLPNRALLLDRLEMAMGRANRDADALAVLFLDLDHFKVVNDSLGHGTGDQLLTVLAHRLGEQIRPGDTVARFGGDEFVVVCEGLADAAEAQIVADRIANAVAEPVRIGESEVVVSASIGIALVDGLHQSAEQVLRDADAAMYEAKARGRARYELFDPRFRTRALDRLEVESALRRALERAELVVHYQPVFDVASGTIVGLEALLRWDHPSRSLLLPSEFLGVAEESGLIVPIGRWVLRTACEQSQAIAEHFPDRGRLQVAVNLSARQVADPNLVAHVTEILEETGIDPGSLTLEITESILMDDVVQSDSTLRQLKSLGIRLAIDDFGTGYSSFAYLQKFPVDVLKVDRSFVTGLGIERGATAITEAIVSLSHTLGLVAIAEGVETPDQLAELARIGCDQAQGFLLSRPLAPAKLRDLLQS